MLKCKVADTIDKLTKGLMFVEELPKDEGMLFVFDRPRILEFWGKNTFIPLDIAFVNRKDEIIRIGHIKPFNLSPVKSDEVCYCAIEANYGYFERNGIKIGDKISIERASFKDDAFITFKSKDSLSVLAKIKESQEKVVKPNLDTVGEPIGISPNKDDLNLPVLNISNIGDVLEDSFDENKDTGVEQKETQPETVDTKENVKEYPLFSNVFDAASWAKNNNEVIRINYITKHGRQITRDVEPHGSFHSKSTMKEILVTFDETVNGIRAFIMGNIGNWSFVGRNFEKKFVVR